MNDDFDYLMACSVCGQRYISSEWGKCWRCQQEEEFAADWVGAVDAPPATAITEPDHADEDTKPLPPTSNLYGKKGIGK